MKDLNTLSLKELRAMATRYKVGGRSKMTKGALVKALEEATLGASVGEPEPLSEASPTARASASADETASEEEGRHPYEEDKPLLPPLALGGIPLGYNREHLSLMVQDPTTLFSYWSVTSGEDDPIFTSGSAEVRLYDITGGQEALVRQEAVEPSAGRWFIHGLAPDRTYRAEFGTVRDGHFEVRLKSAPRQTPPDKPSRVEDDVFISIDVFQSLEDKAEDLRQDLSFRMVPTDPYAGASEHDHAAATHGNAHSEEETVPLPLAEKPVYHGNRPHSSLGDMSSWPSSGVVSSWSSPSSP